MKSLLTTISIALLLIASVAQAQQSANSNRGKVQFSQTLDPEVKQQLADSPVEKKSRVFHRKVSGAELNQGVELTTEGNGAIIQISPLDSVKDGKRIANTKVPRGMTLSNGAQRRPVDDDSIALHRKSQGLREHFPGFYGRAHAMKVPKDMGHGKLRLEAHGNAPADTDYVVYVLDKNSETTLDVKAPKARFSRNGKLILNARASSNAGGGAKASAKIESVTTTLVAPNGKRYAVKGKLRGGNYEVEWPIQVDAKRIPGKLWKVELNSTIRGAKGLRVQRVASIAVDIFEPTASLESIYSDAQGLRLTLDVEQAGRYEVRAQVTGRSANGEYKPALLNYQAEWLETGTREISVPIDSAKLAASGLQAPYRVQNLQLLDQSRMAVLEYRQGGWELTSR